MGAQSTEMRVGDIPTDSTEKKFRNRAVVAVEQTLAKTGIGLFI